jgi:hypothetical protein
LPNFVERLPISRTYIHYHYAFYCIIQLVRDRVVTDDLDLPEAAKADVFKIPKRPA